MQAEPIEQGDHVGGETYADGHVAYGVFQDEVPADDPGDELAHGGVGVSVGAAGNGDHGGQLGVTDGGKSADDGHQDERKRDRGARSGAAEGSRVVDEVFEKRGVQDGTDLHLLAGDGGSDDGENAGTDDG